LKIGLAMALETRSPVPVEPGMVMGADEHALLVSTSDGTIGLRKLQRPGGKMLPAVDFLRGFPVPAGTRLPSLAMPSLLGQRPSAKPSPNPSSG
jgi:methionyl-tRNA formyltransferase